MCWVTTIYNHMMIGIFKYWKYTKNSLNHIFKDCTILSNFILCVCSVVSDSVMSWTVVLHGIFQARILEWVIISYSRRSSWNKDRTCISCIGRRILYNLSHQGSPKYRIFFFFFNSVIPKQTLIQKTHFLVLIYTLLISDP